MLCPLAGRRRSSCMTDRSIAVDPAQGIVFSGMFCIDVLFFTPRTQTPLAFLGASTDGAGGRRQKGIQGEKSHVVESAEQSGEGLGERARGGSGARFVFGWARGGFGLSRWRHCRGRGCHWPGRAKLMSGKCQVFHVSVPVHPSSLPCATMARPERSRIKCKFSSISQQKRHEWHNLFSTTRRCICVAQKGDDFSLPRRRRLFRAHGRARRTVGSGHWTPRVPAHVAAET